MFKRPRAEANLVDIWRDIAQDSSGHADRLLDRIAETLSRLAAMPFDTTGGTHGWRSLA